MTELNENEMVELNENELDSVNGGAASQCADDSRFLNSLAGLTDRYGAFKMMFGTSRIAEIASGWAKVGVIFVGSKVGDNKYYIYGKRVSQEEARQHAMNVTGHHMERKDWDY